MSDADTQKDIQEKKTWHQVKTIRIKWNSIKIKTNRGNIGMSVVYPHQISIGMICYGECIYLSQFNTKPICAGNAEKYTCRHSKYCKSKAKETPCDVSFQGNKNLEKLIGRNIKVKGVNHYEKYCELVFITEDNEEHSIDVGSVDSTVYYSREKLWLNVFYPEFCRGGWFNYLYEHFGDENNE